MPDVNVKIIAATRAAKLLIVESFSNLLSILQHQPADVSEKLIRNLVALAQSANSRGYTGVYINNKK